MTQKNHLKRETSPYLLQHAYNPVAWYPWGEEALNLAKQQNKPILLSIGYSACHWCHVMAHESFDNEQTAELMNQHFINIKVDREERPDLDKIYQTAHHLLAGKAGGWPLTIFLDPKTHIPFYSGTYFPPEPRMQMPSFKQVLEAVAAHYENQAAQVTQQSLMIEKALAETAKYQLEEDLSLNDSPLQRARQELEKNYDAREGGFGGAPKFPMPGNYEFLLDFWRYHERKAAENDQFAMQIALASLVKMGDSGLYDHIGGGFFRYCVDEAWNIPHFEKMLYDNGQLLGLYSRAYAITDHSYFETIIQETAGWILREMQHPEGGFYSSLDADSDEGEGAYYTWDKEEVAALLNHEEKMIAEVYYGMKQAANFEGKWHLQTTMKQSDLAQQLNIKLEQGQKLIAAIKDKLFAARLQRTLPRRDDKILTSWNGLMIAGLAKAAYVLNSKDCLTATQRAIDFIRKNLWQQGRLLACYTRGRAHLQAYLDDYVFLIDGLINALQANWRSEDLQFATELADSLLENFYDAEQGGFFFTAKDHESLIHRPKPFIDEAVPSGNGMAAKVLLQLGYLLGETRYLDAAHKTLCLSWRTLKHNPQHCTGLLQALLYELQPTAVHIVRTQTKDEATWQLPLKQKLGANRLVFYIPADASHLPLALQSKAAKEQTVVYVCQGTQYLASEGNAKTWLAQLES